MTATFDEVVGSFGTAIERLNTRFGTTFVAFEHTPEHVARIEGEIEARLPGARGLRGAAGGRDPTSLIVS